MTHNTREGIEEMLHAIEYILSHPDEGSGDIHEDLKKVLHQELQKAREQRKGWKGYVAVDSRADNYKYSPVFSDRKGAELWVKGKEINGLEVVEVDILLADQSELDQPIS